MPIFGDMAEYLYIRIQNKTIIKHGTKRTDKRLLEEAEERIALYLGIHYHLGLDNDSASHGLVNRAEESNHLLLLRCAFPFSMDVFEVAEDRF